MSSISIAMTTYNGERYVHEQLCSLLSQTRKPDEVIICDDCSTDETLAILRQFIAEHGLTNWHIVESTHNLGYLENFRKAMRLTSGDILFLCDQDDIWQTDKIEKMAAIMEANTHISGLVCGYRIIDGNSNPSNTRTRKFYVPRHKSKDGSPLSKVRRGRTLYYNVAQGCAGAYRRHLTDTYCGIHTCNMLPHDWAINLLAYHENALYFYDEELLLYRIHDHNTIGIASSGQMIYKRIPRLIEYAETIADAVHLPLPKEAKEEVQRLAEFTYVRIEWLRHKNLFTWIKGFFKYFSIVKNYFFFQYAKDFVLVILGKIPK